MLILETLATQNKTFKNLVANIQWRLGRCPSSDFNQEEGHIKYCELGRILEDRLYKSPEHLQSCPTTLPGVRGQNARAVGGVAKLAEEFQVAPRTLRQWAYCDRRPSRNDIALVQAMVAVYPLKVPVLKVMFHVAPEER